MTYANVCLLRKIGLQIKVLIPCNLLTQVTAQVLHNLRTLALQVLHNLIIQATHIFLTHATVQVLHNFS